jgi:hypothetical protein
VHRRSDGKHVFIATEVPENRGTSITNYAEHLATAMRKQYDLKPEDVIWIEHYPEAKHRRMESVDLVRFAVLGDTFRTPVWTRITEQAVDELITGKRSLEDLTPRRTKAPDTSKSAWTLALLSGRLYTPIGLRLLETNHFCC